MIMKANTDAELSDFPNEWMSHLNLSKEEERAWCAKLRREFKEHNTLGAYLAQRLGLFNKMTDDENFSNIVFFWQTTFHTCWKLSKHN